MAYVRSYGAAEVVTGSCHMLRLENGVTILIDCGMFQGEQEEWNYGPFGFDPKKVDILLVTHAHLDHVGRIPKLVKEGFDGIVVATKPTLELAQVVLMDSARLMEEEYKTRFRKAQRSKERGRTKRVVFSGDLGNRNDIVTPYVADVPKADTLFMESTYGDRNHKSLKKSVEEFKEAVRQTLINRGNVIIPSFAIERTQEVLCVLKQMYRDRELPHCKIFLDSPMAIRATHLFSKYHLELGPVCRRFYKEDGDVFGFPWLRFTSDVEDSKRINEIERGAVIIAGSGMCTGGRILHHFKNRLWNDRNSVIFVGYQAEGTLGRYIVDGAKWVRIYNEDIRIRAKIFTINGFSAHADQREMIEWMGRFESLGNICLVHGERQKERIFRKAIRKKLGKKAHIVRFKEKIFL